jgi:glutamate-1-semialdehyde 2,1-aminomutase
VSERRGLGRLRELYLELTPGSSRWHSSALAVHPGGDTRSVVFVPPYPVYMSTRKGAEVTDVDGNGYIDCLNNYTSLIHGGGCAAVDSSIRRQLARGVAFGSPTPAGVELATLLVERVPGIESIRFCNSGTESVMHSVRAARAFTNRTKVLRFRHGYHGSHELTALADRTTGERGADENPGGVLTGTGVTPATYRESLVAPFNDLPATAALADEHAGDLAAILVEPMQNAAGSIVGTPSFIKGLAELARNVGALLIFDEVVTLRLAVGGLQDVLGVKPDLTALGKIIGGGLPIGAFGGRGDVMKVYQPGSGRVAQSGTFNASPLSMAAGLAAMAAYESGEIARLNTLGETLARRLGEFLDENKLPAAVHGMGSLFTVSWSAGVGDPAGDANHDPDVIDLQRAFYYACMICGVQIAPRGLFALSTPMDESMIDEIFSRVTRAVRMLAES